MVPAGNIWRFLMSDGTGDAYEQDEQGGGPGVSWNVGGPLRSNDVRERNEKLVLSLIQSRGEMSQSQVAQETGLRPPTVFRIFSNLEEKAFIEESSATRTASERRGRRPSFYRVNERALYAIGVDLWAGSVAATVVDFSREAVVNGIETFDPGISAESVFKKVEQLVFRLLEQAGVERSRILGIGVAAPGVVDVSRGTVESYERISGMSGAPVAKRLGEAFSLPVIVHNNTSVIAASEYRYGAVKGVESVMAILIRTGVGGAFLQRGRPFTNNGLTALEVGYTIVDPHAHARGEAGTLEEALNEDVLFARMEQACGSADRMTLIDRMVHGDCEVAGALEQPVEALGATIVSLANLFNPGVFLVITRYGALAEYLARGASQYASRDVPGTRLKPAGIMSSEYDPLLACRGASDLVFDRFFSPANE